MNNNLEEELLPPSQEHEAKRRKIRKGTRSCWECKHRKIRCIFLSPDSPSCVECQRRRATCVSQNLPEALAPTKQHSNSRHLGDRIARIEDIVKDLVAAQNAQNQEEEPFNEPLRQEEQVQQPSNSATLLPRPHDRTLVSFHSPLSADSPNYESSEDGESQDGAHPEKEETTKNGHREMRREKRKWVQENASKRATVSRNEVTVDIPTLQKTPNPSEVTTLQHLLAAFPSRDDVRVLAKQSSKSSLYTHLTNFQPHKELTRDALAPADVPDAVYPTILTPRPDMHPVILARQMIIFAITLQSPCGEKVQGLSEPQEVLMSRLMAAATTWVTKNEELQGTLESVLCIMLEGVFEVNCGNLRRAWAVYRRAMTVAQLMGLHRATLPPLKRIDPRLNINAAFMWLRIVYMDRYLSILLGLPQGTAGKSMGSNLHDDTHDTPLGKFEHQLSAIASQILDRNETTFAGGSSPTHFEIAQSIDAQLLEVSKSMPSTFWRPANFHGLTPGSPDTLLETIRLADQVYYNSLLIHLHLPYAISSTGNHTGHEYSKVTCVNASREIMTRFITHRTFNPMSSCSRPVDFFAFLAAMTILLTHIDSHREATNHLAHQRLSDRAMLEQVVDLMDLVSKKDKDAMAQKSAELIRHLLEIESEASQGIIYTRTMVEENQSTDAILKNDNELCLRVPYLGTIKISRQSSSPGGSHEPDSMLQQSLVATDQGSFMYPETSLIEDQHQLDLPGVTAGVDDWVFQGVDMAFFDSLTKGMKGCEINAQVSLV